MQIGAKAKTKCQRQKNFTTLNQRTEKALNKINQINYSFWLSVSEETLSNYNPIELEDMTGECSNTNIYAELDDNLPIVSEIKL
ncbi:MAG: hypothetical protein HWD59_12940 [Coxiellaceae bacterium]|nr:MAG: hypothetical protein HWD59_12940 [Coxiellaceae bacterium]